MKQYNAFFVLIPLLLGVTKGYRQAVRQQALTLLFVGSNPATLAKKSNSYELDFFDLYKLLNIKYVSQQKICGGLQSVDMSAFHTVTAIYRHSKRAVADIVSCS